jgi:hypothetical protein
MAKAGQHRLAARASGVSLVKGLERLLLLFIACLREVGWVAEAPDVSGIQPEMGKFLSSRIINRK